MKDFGAVRALDNVSLDINQGEVLGLMGDNGAGKSTLVKTIAGNFQPTSGTYTLEGKPVTFHGPADARREGIEVVYQDLGDLRQSDGGGQCLSRSRDDAARSDRSRFSTIGG